MSLRIGRFFGINLYLHWSFWLLPLWIAFNHARDPESVTLALRLALLAALFACVVLHEYGHALMARRFGIATRDVTLYPIGGVARLERISERPWEEFCIAIAGPLVNVAIATVLGAGLFLAFAAQPGLLQGMAGEFLLLLLFMNIMLFTFNLIPAFPMDGGRVLRALLAIPFGRLRATRMAVAVSAVIVVLFGTAAAWYFDNPMLILIGVFLLWAGQQELRMLEMREEHEHDHEAMPGEPEFESHRTPRSTATVYLWDPRKHTWVPQGAIPSQDYENSDRIV
jgi:Zn-dependent protease